MGENHKKFKVDKETVIGKIVDNRMVSMPVGVTIGFGIKSHKPTVMGHGSVTKLILDTDNKEYVDSIISDLSNGGEDFFSDMRTSYMDYIKIQNDTWLTYTNGLTRAFMTYLDTHKISRQHSGCTCVKYMHGISYKFKKTNLIQDNLTIIKKMYSDLNQGIEHIKQNNIFGYIHIRDVIDSYKYCIIIIRYDKAKKSISSWIYNDRLTVNGSMPIFVRETVRTLNCGISVFSK